MDAHIVTGREPISEEEMLKMYKVNQDFWTPDRLVHNNWGVSMRRKDGEIAQALNHQTKLFLKPKYGGEAPEWSVEIMEDILKGKGVMRPDFTINTQNKEQLLGGLMLTDLHLDLMDVKNNTFKKRIEQTNGRIKKVLDRLLKFDPDKLLVAQMGDLFNSDQKFKTSSHKVILQNTMHEKDAFRRIIEWTIGMLEELKSYGVPIEYRIVPGNHDYEKTEHYGVALEYYFNGGIEIKTERNRAYIPRGETVIALGHGDNEKPENFLQFLTDEYLRKGNKAKNIHGYLGNQHKQIISQNGPMLIKNLLAPNTRSDRTEQRGYDMVQGMHGFIRDKKDGEIVEVRG